VQITGLGVLQAITGIDLIIVKFNKSLDFTPLVEQAAKKKVIESKKNILINDIL
jgi:hypothetical protein